MTMASTSRGDRCQGLAASLRFEGEIARERERDDDEIAIYTTARDGA